MTRNQIRFKFKDCVSKYKRSVKIKRNIQDRVKRINTLQSKSIELAHEIIHSATTPEELVEILKLVKLPVDSDLIRNGWKNTLAEDTDFDALEWGDVLHRYSKQLEARIVEESEKGGSKKCLKE